MGLSELGLTFFKVGGHTHDGVNSSKIDLTNYAESDLAYINALIRRAIGQAGGFGNFPEGISIGIGSADGSSGSGSVFVGGYTPPPTGLTLSTGVSQIEREIIYIDAIWSPPDPLTVPSGNQSVEYEVTLKKTGDTVLRISRTKTPQIRFSPVDPGTSYQVTVRGINGLNVPSSVLGPSTITSAVDSVAPATPTGLASSGGLKTVSVTWNENSETDVAKGRGFYDVQIALSSATFAGASGLTPTLQTQRVNATLATFTGLDSFVSYKVTVRAVDSSGNASNYATAVAVSTGGLAPTDSDGTSSIPWEQTWEQFSIADWDIRSGSSGDFARVTGQGSHGGNVLRASNTGVKWLSWKYNFAYDPNKTYKISFRIRANASTLANIYLGVFGIAADGTTLVDTAGGTSVNAQYAFAANNQSVAAGSAWTTYTGYIRGVSGSPAGGSFADPNTPGPMHTNAKYFRPFFEATNAASATYDIDSISVEEVGFLVGNQNIGALAVSNGNLQDNSVGTTKITAGAVTAAKVGFTIGGGNLLTNSSFEDTTLNGWTFVGSWSSSSTNPRSGARSLSHTTTNASETSAASILTGISPSTAYTFSFYAVGPNSTGDQYQARIEWYTAASALISTSNGTALFSSSASQRVTLTATAPSNAAFCKAIIVAPAGSNGNGTWFDACQLEEADVATSYAPKPDEILPGTVGNTQLSANAVTYDKMSVGIGGGNMLGNSSWENDDGLWVGGSAPITRTLDTTEHFHGAKSAKAVVAATSGQVISYFNQFIRGVGGTTLPHAPLVGQKITMSIWVKITAITGGSLSAQWEIWNSAESASLASISLFAIGAVTSGWQRFSATMTVPTNGDHSRILIQQFNGAGTSSSTYYLDAWQLEVGDLATAYSPAPEEILPGTIGTTEIADNAITTQKIIANAITANKIAANTITASQIAANTITASQIAADTITANEIAANAITVNELAANSVNASKIVANTITASQIAANTITAAQILADTITANEIAANAITASELSANAVTATKIQAGAVSTEKLTVGASTIFPFNGGFEDISAADANLAANWHVTTNGGPETYALTTTSGLYMGGARGLRLSAGASTVGITYNCDRFPVQAGDIYAHEFWYRCETALSTGFYYQVYYFNAAGSQIATSNLVSNAGGSAGVWNFVQTTHTAPANAVMCQIYFNINNPNASVFIDIDELRITSQVDAVHISDGAITAPKITAGSVTTEKLTVASIGENVVLNPGFEDAQQADATKPANWSTGYSGSTNSTYAFDATNKVSGSRGYSVSIASAPTTSQGNIATDTFPVVPGATYYASVTARVSSAITNGFYVRWAFGTAQGFTGEPNSIDTFSNVALTTSFVAKEGSVIVPAGQTWARLVVYLYQPNVTTVLTVDDVVFKKLVVSAVIADGAITTNKMTANTINGDRIFTGTLNADKITSGTIQALQIATNTLTADKMLITVGGTSNLLNNSSFENVDPGAGTGLSRWTKFPTGGAATRSNAVTAQQSAFHAAITNSSGGTQTIGIQTYFIPTYFNATYSFQIWIRAAATIRSCSAQINWYDADNVFLSSSNGSAANDATGSWTKFTVTGTCPSNAVKLQCYGLVGSTANGEVHYFDAAMLEIAGSPSATWVPNPIELAPGTIMSDNIVAGTITGDKIAANSITAGDAVFGTAAIVSADINTLTATKLTAGTITGQNIIVGGSTKSTTIASGSNGVVLSTNPTTINVANTVDFPNTGVFSIYNGSTFIGNISYTGKPNGTQFTGCAPSGSSATLATGMTVSGPNATTGAGVINSANYAPGTAGWYIDQAGNVEFNNAVFRGAVYGSYITGSTVTGGLIRTAVSGTRIEINSSANVDKINLYTSNPNESAPGFLFTGYGTYDIYAPSTNKPITRLNAPTTSGQTAQALITLSGPVSTDTLSRIIIVADKIGFQTFSGGTMLDFTVNSINTYGSTITGNFNGQAPKIAMRAGNIFSVDWGSNLLTFYTDTTQHFQVNVASNTIQVAGFAAKTFVINHPTDISKYLVHATVEGPTSDVVYRGKNKIGSGGIVYIKVPEYFEALTHEDNRTVQLTAKGSGTNYPKNLRATDVIAGGFYVEADTPGQFDWEVTAERKDIPRLEVEPRKADYVLSGDGPYTYLEKRMGGIIN